MPPTVRMCVYRLPLVWLAIAVIAGAKIPGMDFVPETLQLVLQIVLLAACYGAYCLKQHGLASGLALVSAFVFGMYYVEVNRPSQYDSLSVLAQRKPQPVAVQCVVTSAAVWKPNPNFRPQVPTSEAWRTQWQVRCDRLRDGRLWTPISARSSLTVDGRVDDLFPGDMVEVLGNLRCISEPTNPGGFDYARHNQADSVFTALTADSRSQVKLLENTGQFPWLRLRAWLVMQFDHSLHRWVAFSQAPLAAALVFGQREQVDWEDQQELMATGTLHLLAISGMHVEIVAGALLFLAPLISRRPKVLLVVLILICGGYAALAGGKPPVLRAFIVVAIFALAQTLGRQARIANALGAAALILTLVRVANVDNVGVHLSFLAVGTIGVFAMDCSRSAERKSALQRTLEDSLGTFRWLGLKCYRGLKKASVLSLWVWLITCPLIWLNFHIIAPIAIPLNVAIALPLTISLIAGLAAGGLGWIAPIGWLAGLVCGASLSLISWLVSIGRSFPAGHIWLPAPPTWWLVCFYAIASLWLLAFGRSRNQYLLLLLLGWLGVGIVPPSFGPRGWYDFGTEDSQAAAPATPAASEMRVTFLDVGHGTSVIIEMPTRQVWLYDAGHLGATERSHEDIASALWQLPTARVERLVISHADTDHYNATQGLDERFRIAHIASTSHFWRSTDVDVAKLLRYLQSSTLTQAWSAGEQGSVGEVRWEVLHPTADWSGESDNAASLCLMLEYAGKRVLLPGDLEGSGLVGLTHLPPRPCHVLMAPHHGSTALDPSELLTWCRPEVVVISGNHRATRPEVLEKYRTAEARLGITFRDGAIQVRINGVGELSTWHWQTESWVVLD